MKLLMSLLLYAKTVKTQRKYVVFLVWGFKICHLYSYDQKISLKVLECFETVRGPKERAKVSCNDGEVKRLEDTVVEIARKTGNNTVTCLKLFAFCSSSRTLKSLQIG